MCLSFSQKAILAAVLLLAGLQAEAFSEFRKFQDNLWEFEFNTSYFKTENNYLSSGNSFDSLPGGGSYNLMDLGLGVRWSWSNSWSVYSQGKIGIADSKDAAGVARSNSQFNALVLGTDFLLWDGPIQLIPDIQGTFPIARADNSSDSVQTAEGATEILARLITKFNFSRFHNQGFVGFIYRDEGRASLLNYGVGTDFEFGRWYLGAEVRGFSTIIEDQDTSNPLSREAQPLKVNGGSKKFNSINPSLLESNFWYRFESDSWGIQLGGGLTITGTNSAHGYRAFANFTYRFQGKESLKSAPKSDIERFREETNDGVDQILFQPPPTPTPVPKRLPDPRKKIKKDLDQTEMHIELKSKKKKRP